MAYNDDAREASSVTGRALATVAIGVVGAGTAGLGIHLGKKAFKAGAEFAGGVKKNGLLAEIGERAGAGKGVRENMAHFDDRAKLEKEMAEARGKHENKKRAEERAKAKEDYNKRRQEAMAKEKAEQAEIEKYQREAAQEEAAKVERAKEEARQRNINSASKKNNAFDPRQNQSQGASQAVKDFGKPKVIGNSNNETSEVIKNFGKPRVIEAKPMQTDPMGRGSTTSKIHPDVIQTPEYSSGGMKGSASDHFKSPKGAKPSGKSQFFN